jgi:hypothetical protein
MDQALLAFGRGELKQTALYLLLIWLASTVAASWLSERKGYGEKPGLAAGLLLSAAGALLWVLWPPRRDSKWKVQGIFGKGSGKTVAEARAEMADEEASGPAPSAPGGDTERGDPRT